MTRRERKERRDENSLAPPLPLTQTPPLRIPPTPLETELQTAELVEAAHAQRTRLKKLYGSRKSSGDPDEESRSDQDDSRSPPKQKLDVIA